MANKDDETKRESVLPEGSLNSDPKDTRDTNMAPKSALVGRMADDTKIVNQFPDGSVEDTTFGALAETHGDPMGGPSVADLNPAFAPTSEAHNGAAK